jgi:uncharacterized membrane protein HdeD (DUF308 family)
MLDMLARSWWVFAIRGLAALIFGIACELAPGMALYVLILLFGAYAIVDGLALELALVRGDATARRNGWTVGLIGLLGVAAGAVAFVWPNLTALALLYVVALWAFAAGIFQVVAAISLRREIEGEWWMALGGAVSIAFAVLLVIFPGAGLLSIIWLVGLWSILFGLVALMLAWRLRRLPRAAMA